MLNPHSLLMSPSHSEKQPCLRQMSVRKHAQGPAGSMADGKKLGADHVFSPFLTSAKAFSQIDSLVMSAKKCLFS